MDDQIRQLLINTGDVALRRRATFILGRMIKVNPRRILDIGCGDGFYLHLTSFLFPDSIITGIDTDKAALESARKNVKNRKVLLSYGDISQLKYRNKSFDVVLLSEVLEHVDDDLMAIKEAYRVLKRGGMVFISVPHKHYPFLWDPVNWILERTMKTHIKKGFWAGIWNQHLRLYDQDQLLSVLKNGGFKKIKLQKLTHYCLPFNHHLINFGARILAKRYKSGLRRKLSKFSTSSRKSSVNPIYSILFKVDEMNDKWNGDGSALSLVAFATK